MSLEDVKEFFKKWGLDERIQEFDVSSATVELAAKALQCEPGCIAKTLSFKVNERPILIVLAGDTKIDNQKYKAKFGTKAKMLTAEETIQWVGHAIGGVCPFAIPENVKVYLDQSLKRFEYIFPACGSSNSAFKLSLDELEKYSKSIGWIDVSKTAI